MSGGLSKRFSMRSRSISVFSICQIASLIFVTISVSSCAMLGGMVGESVKKPEVDFVDARISGLSFDAADLMFDVKVSNPNSLGLKMAGFNYDLLINGNSFLKGKQERQLEIEARGESIVQLPLTLNYMDLYRTFQGLLDQDSSTYQINFGFSFDVPVLGVVNIPISKSGDLPLLKLPKVKLDTFKVSRLNLTGAEVLLGVKLNNPNAFAMLLEHLQYSLDIDGRSWFSGDTRDSVQVTEKGEGVINIPVSISFLEIGRSAYQLLSGDKELNYKFGGELDFGTTVPLLEKFSLPFDHSGQIEVTR